MPLGYGVSISYTPGPVLVFSIKSTFLGVAALEGFNVVPLNPILTEFGWQVESSGDSL